MNKPGNSRKRQRTTVRTHGGLHFADVDFNHSEPRLYIYCKGKDDYITMSELQQKVEAARREKVTI